MPEKKVRKRDGSVVDFNKEKIVNAIFKSAQSVGGSDKKEAERVADTVVEYIAQKFKDDYIPTVEEVQDLVEKALIETGHASTAKSYILYRHRKTVEREAKRILGVRDDLKLPLNSIQVLERRYLLRDDDGKIIETPSQLFRRVADFIASNERNYEADDKTARFYADAFFEIMTNFEFLPNSPTLMNAGTGLGQLAACFVLPVKDDIEAIFEAVKHAAIIHKTGGGCVLKGSRIFSTFCGSEPIDRLYNFFDAGVNIQTENDAFFIDISQENLHVPSFDKDTGNMRFMPVSKIWKYILPSEKTYTVHAEGGYTATTSEWHPFFVFENNMVLEKRADELKESDFLVSSNPSLKESWQFTKNHSIEGIELDEDFAWLAGIFSTDGSLDEIKQGLRLRIFSADQEIIDRALGIIEKKTGIHYATETDYRSKSPVMRITAYNKELTNAMRKLNRGILGNKTQTVRIPSEVFKSPLPIIGAYLAGVIDGDGHIQKNKPQCEVSGASKEFSEDLCSIFSLFGIKSRYRKRVDNRNPNWVDMHEVSVSGHMSIQRLAELVLPYITLERKRSRLEMHAKKTHSSNSGNIDFGLIEPILNEAGIVTDNTQIWRKSIKVGNLKIFLARWKEKGKINQVKAIALLEELLKMNISEESGKKLRFLINVLPNLKKIKSVKRNSGNTELEFYDFTVPKTQNYLAGNMGLSIIHNTGFCFSYLRPKGDFVKSTAGVASGPISFMSAFDNATNVIKQGGKRRGANMGVLHIWHPDIEEFITAKQTSGVLENFNVSVAVDDKFMDAVDKDSDYELMNPRNGKPARKVNARSLFKLIAYSAWKSAEPGLLFIDTINNTNPTPKFPIKATNPCVSADTLVTTNEGLVFIHKVHNPLWIIGSDGIYHPVKWAGPTGEKEVFLVKTNAGYEVKATADHKLLTANGWKMVSDLNNDDELVAQKEGSFGNNHLDREQAVKIMNDVKDALPESVFTMDRETINWLLSALFNKDIEKAKEKESALKFKSNSLKLLKQIQILLLQFGILSKIDVEQRELISSAKVNLHVNSIENAGIEKVYDLTEPMTGSFSANGLIAHNCGEVPMPDYESCNLGSINLVKFVDFDWSKTSWKKKIDWKRMRYVIRLAVQFLDNVIDLNNYPIAQIREQTQYNRRMGLGVMGFAKMLTKIGVRYDSEQGDEIAQEVMRYITDEARKMSHELGRARGSFPGFKDSVYADKFDAMRNSTVTSIAPTGTISMIADSSSGIEPLFALSYIKTVMDGTKLYYSDDVFEHVLKVRGLYSPELMQKVIDNGTIQGMDEIPKEIQHVFVVAHDIGVTGHVNMQAEFQKHTDLAVSKTINMPAEVTVEDIEKAYLLAWKTGCKGITIYRDGSRGEGVLSKGKKKVEEAPKEEKNEG